MEHVSALCEHNADLVLVLAAYTQTNAFCNVKSRVYTNLEIIIDKFIRFGGLHIQALSTTQQWCVELELFQDLKRTYNESFAAYFMALHKQFREITVVKLLPCVCVCVCVCVCWYRMLVFVYFKISLRMRVPTRGVG
jgi:hypothetical protein